MVGLRQYTRPLEGAVLDESTVKTAYLFPGQGAQYPGMGRDFYDASAEVRRLFEEASDIGGRDWARVLFEGSAEDLQATDTTQVAITLINLSASIMLKDYGIHPSVCSGFSLGEYSALHEAGVLNRTDLLRVVEKRGKVLERVSRSMDTDAGAVGMKAVLGLNIDEVAEAIAGIPSVHIAIHSGPNQVVLSGTFDSLAAVEKPLDAAGAMNLVPLKVSGPFHSPLLEGALEEFGGFLSEIPFVKPEIPVFMNTSAEAPSDGEAVNRACLDQLVKPVRWMDCEKAVMQTGPERVLEIGPGRVLCGLWKTLRNGMKCQAAGTLENIEELR